MSFFWFCCPPDDNAVTPGTNGEATNGIEVYHSGDGFQWQRSLRKSGSASMRKQSSKREDNHREALKRQLIEEEELERGSVSFSVYWSYATAVYKGALVFVIIGCQIGFMVCLITSYPLLVSWLFSLLFRVILLSQPGFLVGSWLLCTQHLPFLVSFWCHPWR